MKYALIVGINKYQMSGCDLNGCVNDADKMYNLCRIYGFDEIKVLTDEAATQENIILNLTSMVNNTAAGDEVFYAHSGHGTQVVDMDGDEVDGLDECIVPYDHDWDRPFTDDRLASCLRNLHNEAYLSVLIDACHSGSATDNIVKNIVMPESMRKLVIGKSLRKNYFGVKNSNPTTQRHILLAGCKDNEYSYELQFGNKSYGALTFLFEKTIRSKAFRNSNWNRIFRSAYRRVVRKTGNAQHPVLSGETNLKKRIIFSGM